MTLKNIVEEVRQIFPTMGETYLVKLADFAQKDFARKTRMESTTVSLSSPNDNVVWTLPTDFLVLKDINYYDSDDNPLYEGKDIYVEAEIDRDKILFKNTQSSDITGLPSKVNEVQLVYYNKPSTLDSVSATFEVDEVFQDAIRAKMFERMYATIPVNRDENGSSYVDKALMGYWKDQYENAVREARRWKTDDRPMSIQNYQYAGAFIDKKPVKSTAASTLDPVSDSYSKYYRFKAVSPSTLTEQATTGFGSITLSMSSGTIVVESSAEFDKEMFVVPNQNINYNYISSSKIELYPPSNWGTLVVEIYKR